MATTQRVQYWEQRFHDNPDAMFQLLNDLYSITQGSHQERRLGSKWSSQRAAGSFDELWDMLTPDYSVKPFPEAFRDALGDRSVRGLCEELCITRRTLQRLLDGSRPVVNLSDPAGSMRELEHLAEALGLHPAYFAEWRRLWIYSTLDTAFTTDPTASITFIKRYASQATAGRRV